MGRSLAPKTIQVILPPTAKASSSSTKDSTSQVDAETPEQPSLQVLILAQEIARKRGQVFDIGSFLTPLQRKEYRRLVHGVDEESIETPPTPITGDTEQLDTADGDMSIGDGAVNSAKRAFDDINDDLNPASTSTTPLPTNNTPLPEPPATANTDLIHPPPTSSSDVPTESIAAKRARLQSMNMHWTQRRKKLQELAKLESEGIKEVPLSPQERPPLPEIGLGLMAVPQGKGKAPERGAIQASVSYWNHLLTQARKERGPQWDYNTQTYHVDRSTPDYYSHINKPLDSSLPPQKPIAGQGQPQNLSSMANGYHAADGDAQRRMESQRRSGSISNSTNGYGEPSALGRPPAFTSTPANHAPQHYQPSPSRNSMSGSVPPQSPHHSQQLSQQQASMNLQDYQRRMSQSQHQQPGRPPANGPPNSGQYQFTPQQLAQIAQLSSSGQQGGMNFNPALLQQLAQAQNQAQGQGQGQGGINLAQMQQQLARANQLAQAGQSGYAQPGPGQQGQAAQLQAQFQQFQLAQMAATQNQGKGPSGMPPSQDGQQMRGVNPAMLANFANMQNQNTGQRRDSSGGINLAQLGGMGQQPGSAQFGANGFKSGPGQGQNLGGQGQGVMLSGGGRWQE